MVAFTDSDSLSQTILWYSSPQLGHTSITLHNTSRPNTEASHVNFAGKAEKQAVEI